MNAHSWTLTLIYPRSKSDITFFDSQEDARDMQDAIIGNHLSSGAYVQYDDSAHQWNVYRGQYLLFTAVINRWEGGSVDLDDSERNVPLTASDEAYNDFGRPLGWKQW